jgi:hypothetical protein
MLRETPRCSRGFTAALLLPLRADGQTGAQELRVERCPSCRVTSIVTDGLTYRYREDADGNPRIELISMRLTRPATSPR